MADNALGMLFSDIADAIRGKTGDTATMKPAEFPDKIAGIETGAKETILEGLEFQLDYVDLSAGAASFDAGDGYLIKSAVLIKPEGLTPENIASGVTICGVEGTLEAGSGSVAGVHFVTFMSEDGTTELYKRPVADGDNCADPVARWYIEAPTKESTAQYDYTYAGWSATIGGSASDSVLNAVTADKTVYAAYTPALRSYTVTYYDGETLLKSETYKYGQTPAYEPAKDGYGFGGWEPELAPVTGDATYYAQWTEVVTFANASWSKIAEISEAGEAENYFSVGETKNVQLAATDGTSISVEFVIIGFNHDDLADGSGKAGITLASKTSLTIDTITGITQTNVAWYANGSARRNTYQDNVFNGLSETLKSVIKPVNKLTKDQKTGTVYTTVDTVWVPSATEVQGANSAFSLAEGEEGNRYEYYETKANSKFYMQNLTGVTTSNKESAARDQYYNSYARMYQNVMYVYNGSAGYASSDVPQWAVICFCI